MQLDPLERPDGPRLSHRRIEVLAELLIFLGTWVGLTWLGVLITRAGPALATKLDVWFGADLIRHRDWVTGEAGWAGSARHPLAFVLYHGWGWLLRAVGLRNPSLVLAAAPLTLATSATLALMPRVLRLPRWFVLVSGLAIGPVLLMAALPESHLWGGLSMLWSLAWVVRAHEGATDRTRASRLAALFGLLAIGFTITNLIPALIVLTALPSSSRRGSVSLALAGGLGAGLLFLLSLAIKAGRPSSGGFDESLEVELRQFAWPSAWAAAKSPRELIVAQFGLVRPWLRPFWDSGPGVPCYRLLPLDRVDPRAAVAAAAWFVGSLLGARRARAPERSCGYAGLLALASLVALHAMHDPAEAYLFAPHAWPFVLLPGLLAFRTTPNLAVRVLLVLAVALSGSLAVQAIARLLPLLPYLPTT